MTIPSHLVIRARRSLSHLSIYLHIRLGDFPLLCLAACGVTHLLPTDGHKWLLISAALAIYTFHIRAWHCVHHTQGIGCCTEVI